MNKDDWNKWAQEQKDHPAIKAMQALSRCLGKLLNAGAGGARQECVLCTRHVRPDRAAAPSRHGLVSAGCAVALFLAVVGVGIAVDISAKAQGLVAFAVFAGAFWVFLRYVDG